MDESSMLTPRSVHMVLDTMRTMSGIPGRRYSQITGMRGSEERTISGDHVGNVVTPRRPTSMSWFSLSFFEDHLRLTSLSADTFREHMHDCESSLTLDDLPWSSGHFRFPLRDLDAKGLPIR